ncbi:hypothetical protein F2P81_009428 [Scophthalmus maximus]|uniref:Uncharacterized protein n=1 Tax=Scophthalmus maximus TaxID=52904 RepID=A0A6A4T6Y5_SCOMX|nr:hypothetical protein F2P81_009428 [Scophthalmus maximus]
MVTAAAKVKYRGQHCDNRTGCCGSSGLKKKYKKAVNSRFWHEYMTKYLGRLEKTGQPNRPPPYNPKAPKLMAPVIEFKGDIKLEGELKEIPSKEVREEEEGSAERLEDLKEMLNDSQTVRLQLRHEIEKMKDDLEVMNLKRLDMEDADKRREEKRIRDPSRVVTTPG